MSEVPKRVVLQLAQDNHFFLSTEELGYYNSPFDPDAGEDDDPLPEYEPQGHGIAATGKMELRGTFARRFLSTFHDRYSVLLQKSLAKIVRQSSQAQTLKGLITADPAKSLRYGLRKVSKFTSSKAKS